MGQFTLRQITVFDEWVGEWWESMKARENERVVRKGRSQWKVRPDASVCLSWSFVPAKFQLLRGTRIFSVYCRWRWALLKVVRSRQQEKELLVGKSVEQRTWDWASGGKTREIWLCRFVGVCRKQEENDEDRGRENRWRPSEKKVGVELG